MSSGYSVCFVLLSAYGYFNTDVEVVGGGARQLSFISRAITDEFDVHFIVGDYGQQRREEYDGVTLHRAYTPSPDTPVYKKPIQLLRLLNAMRRAEADVYVYRGRPFQAAVVYSLARLFGQRYVYNIANDPNLDEQPASLPAPVRWLFKRALTHADGVVAQTDTQAGTLRQTYGVDPTVVPSGYPPADSIRPHDRREHFLWVGRLDADQKRPHRYVDLAEQLPDVEFLLVGPEGQDDDYNAEVRGRTDELANLEYVGPVDPEEIHHYYRDAIALVNTSAYEGFPSTFLEAWRYETPVVSLDVPVARYAQLDTYEGDLGGDFAELVSLTARLDSEPSLRASLAAPTVEYFNEHLTIEQVADRYASVLRSVIDH